MPSSEKPRNYVKSFFAPTLQAALEQAGRELGPDALLLDTREAPPEARHLGAYEVVFGVSEELERPLGQARDLPSRERKEAVTAQVLEQPPLAYEEAGPFPPSLSISSVTPTAPPDAGPLRDFYRRLRHLREIYGLQNPTAPLVQRAAFTDSEARHEVSEWLVAAGVEAALAEEIEAAARRRIAPSAGPRPGASHLVSEPAPRLLWRKAEEELTSRFSVAPQLGRVTALVGPPGSGKTTTLIKLAIRHGSVAGRPVRLISADTGRIGGAGQLQSFASAFQIPFEAADGIASLAQAIAAAPADVLVLIDTPGLSARMLQQGDSGLAAYLSRRQDIDTQLVLTASMRLTDLYRTAALYSSFHPSKLIFTRLDETSSMAAAFCVAARRNLPLSFLAAGQSVPEDLEPADRAVISRSLVRQLPQTLAAVA